MDFAVVLQVLVKKGPLGIDFLKGGPNQTGNLHYGYLGDGYFEQLPCRPGLGSNTLPLVLRPFPRRFVIRCMAEILH